MNFVKYRVTKKILKLNLILIFLGLNFLLIFYGCKKQEENLNPFIRFIQPNNNLIIDNDTTITFIVEAFDKDGTIDRVEFIKKGALVRKVSYAPYSYDWCITTTKDAGVCTIKAIAFDNHNASGEAEIQIEIRCYLSKWVGLYEGTSHHWSSYPAEINGQWQIVTNHTYKKVSAEVSLSSMDSCLDFTIKYDDTIVEKRNELRFSTQGNHTSQWGAASGYGSLIINFFEDSLKYNYFQKCGIPCSSGIDFAIHKK